MKAIEAMAPCLPEGLRLADVPVPQPAEDEVLIQVAAAGVNRADILQRKGKYPPPHGVSEILGLEVSGIVATCGAKVTRFKVGDRVCALLEGGGYAAYAVAAESQCFAIGNSMSFTNAAALPEALFTVWSALFDAGRLKPDDTILIHGGSSGIGSMAIMTARLHGARVYATAGSARKCAACLELGAGGAINYREQDFVAEIRRLTDQRGVDVVLDMVGGEYVNRNLSSLAPGGRHVSIAVQGGRYATLDMLQILQKSLTLTGIVLRHRSRSEKAKLAQDLGRTIWSWIELGLINPLIYQKFPLERAGEAHKVMESGEQIGKIVLEVAPL